MSSDENMEEPKVSGASLLGGDRRTEIWNRIVSESMAVGAVVVLGTLVAWLYEFGYATQGFGVPRDLIQVDTPGIICSTALVGATSLISMGGGYLAFALRDREKRPPIEVLACVTCLVFTYIAVEPPMWALLVSIGVLFVGGFLVYVLWAGFFAQPKI
jgi:hypothetical protein